MRFTGKESFGPATFATAGFAVFFLLLAAAAMIRAGDQKTVDPGRAAGEVAAREREFAARAQVVNPRDAFLEFFAAEAVMFAPGPVSSRDRLLKSPPWNVNLQWWPLEIAVSADGKLACSTGPVEQRRSASDPEPAAFGTYFSIWRRDASGAWEVAADLGTDTPELFGQREERVRILLPEFTGGKAKITLREADSAYAADAAGNLAAALAKRIDPRCRLCLPGKMPLIGLAQIKPALQPGSGSWTIAGEIVALSGDFGAVYGSGRGGYLEGPYGFLRVWRLDAQGNWCILAEVLNAPAEQLKPAGDSGNQRRSR